MGQTDVQRTPEQLFAFFDRLGLVHETHWHASARSVADPGRLWADVPGILCKSLFLRDARRTLWLLVAPAEKRIDLKSLATAVGSARLHFASSDLLQEVLGVQPGVVTPFALLNDEQSLVTMILDEVILAEPRVKFHPLVDNGTTTMRVGDFLAFLKATGHQPQTVALP